MNRHPAGVILTGGASRRMGADKAFVVVDGRPMVVAVADALWEAGCHPVGCQGGDVLRLATVGLDAEPDASPGAGPVAAIVDALRRVAAPMVVAACDLVHVDADTVRTVIDAGTARTGVVTAAAEGRRHLLSYWTPDVIDALAAVAGASYRTALDAVGASEIAVDPETVRNINAPGDLDSPGREHRSG